VTDPERRQRIEDLCDAALDRDAPERAAFVAAACGDDEALRREVEALLAHAHKAEGFLATPIGGVAALILADERGALVGRHIGPYRMLSLIGAGGMGDVYRASDTRLGRDVAIKVVPDRFRSIPSRLARFELEARVLATLNHPHIGAIYGLEEADGIRGLVLELVEGPTLAERLATSRLSIEEALAVARQIADALEAAHEKGVIHRDLKPANVKITSEGTVKVLDFGLAKVFATEESGNDGSETPTIPNVQTGEGEIAGTTAYMSPEQTRGKIVDKRTDIWAFGCVVHEMLTARPAFAGETSSDTVVAILEREPDWSALPAQTPPSIKRLLQRCLEKDSKRRLRR
jgi:eukaryotic-like serine/threonine-protein kinase